MQLDAKLSNINLMQSIRLIKFNLINLIFIEFTVPYVFHTEMELELTTPTHKAPCNIYLKKKMQFVEISYN